MIASPIPLASYARYFGLSLLFLCFLAIVVFYKGKVQNLSMLLSRQYNIDETCEPGIFRDVGQLPYSLWQPYSEQDMYLPMYWTHPISQVNNDVKYAIIVQHGNLRNANDYFCAAVESLQEILNMTSNKISPKSFYIISPQFLVDDDICWHPVTNEMMKISIRNNVTCSYYVWNSEGWKDGYLFLNKHYITTASMTIPGSSGEVKSVQKHFYSYDVFNMLIDQLMNSGNFPNLEKVVLFGFSAGGQTVLRYSMWPTYQLPTTNRRRELRKEGNNLKEVKFVVADISTYLYLDDRRPYPKVSSEPYTFAVPNASWLLPQYQYDAHDEPWLTTWNEECEKYNDWRYGLNNLRGYYDHHAQLTTDFQQEIVRGFLHRNIHFLVGMNDSRNCKLQSIHDCNDNELATYCEAMVQGENRLDRFEKWKAYIDDLEYRYNYTMSHSHSILKGTSEELIQRSNISFIDTLYQNSTIASTFAHVNATKDEMILHNKVWYVRDVSHDPIAMLKSKEAKCLVFNYCPKDSNFLVE